VDGDGNVVLRDSGVFEMDDDAFYATVHALIG
jgi:hypothetical protein